MSSACRTPPDFLPTPGAPSEPWPAWKRDFLRYLEAVGAESFSPKRKKAILWTFLGDEGQRVADTFQLSDPVEGTSDGYRLLLSALDAYFAPVRNASVEKTPRVCDDHRNLASEPRSRLANTDAIATQHGRCSALRHESSQQDGEMSSSPGRDASGCYPSPLVSPSPSSNAVPLSRPDARAPGPSRRRFPPRSFGGRFSAPRYEFFLQRARCSTCAWRVHPRKRCPAQDATCFACGRKGHFARACPGRAEDSSFSTKDIQRATIHTVRSTQPRPRSFLQTHWVRGRRRCRFCHREPHPRRLCPAAHACCYACGVPGHFDVACEKSQWWSSPKRAGNSQPRTASRRPPAGETKTSRNPGTSWFREDLFPPVPPSPAADVGPPADPPDVSGPSCPASPDTTLVLPEDQGAASGLGAENGPAAESSSGPESPAPSDDGASTPEVQLEVPATPSPSPEPTGPSSSADGTTTDSQCTSDLSFSTETASEVIVQFSPSSSELSFGVKGDTSELATTGQGRPSRERRLPLRLRDYVLDRILTKR